MEKSKKEKRDKEIIWALFLILVVFLLWFISWILIDSFIPTFSDRGIFGDKFGAVNALFSGLAFSGVIYAILLQRKELELQRYELKMTRTELEGQKEQLEAQNNTFQEQTLQNAFFQMLNYHNKIVDGFKFKYSEGSQPYENSGREAFKPCYEVFCRKCGDRILSDSLDLVLYDNTKKVYRAFYQENQHELGHYFRNLYNIIKFIDTKNLQDKKYYTNLVRAQLSVYELLILFYNCEFGLGKPKFKPLIEKYALLKTLDEKLLRDEDQKKYYEDRAFI